MEKFKNFLVVFLSFTMCLLCFATLIVMSGGDADLRSIFIDETEYENAEKEKTVYKNMAIPYRISVIAGENVYTEQGVSKNSQFFKDCEKLLLEAVGSMSQLEECAPEQYSEAIRSKSLVFTLNGRLPLYLMQMWSGGTDGYENQTSTIALVRESKGIKVYFTDDETGKCYSSQTSSANAVIDELIANYAGDNGTFVSETLLSDNPPKAMEYMTDEQETAIDEGKMEDILRVFSINPYIAKTYQAPGGDRVYVEEDDVLSVSTEGSITYRASEGGIALKHDGTITEHESVGLAANKLAEISALLYSDMPYVSADIVSVEKQQDEIHIGGIIKLDGIPVSEDVYSAGVIVRDGVIVRMWIDMPGIYPGEMKTLLSDVMAHSINDEKDGRYEVIYMMENGILTPVNAFVE